MKKILILLIALILVPLVYADTELIAHYIVNEVTGLVMENTVGTNGTVSNSSIWNETGKLNGAIYPNKLYNALTPAYPSMTNYTYAMWVKIDSYASNQHIFNAGGAHYVLFLEAGDDTGVFIRFASGTTFAVPAMGTNVWFHLAIVNNPDGVRVYINGTESVTGTVSTEDENMPEIQHFWGEDNVGSSQFDGFIDDIRLYNGSLANATILNIYNNGTGNETDDVEGVAPSDTVLPRINSSINNSVPKINEVINISANVTDETDLGDCVFSTNQTDGSSETKAVSGTDDKCSQNFTISMSRGNVINYTVLIDDGINFNQSSHIITVQNTAPTQPNIVNLSGQTFNVNFLVNTTSFDVDGDTLTYTLRLNGSIVGSGIGFTNWTTNISVDGFYNLSYSVTDGIDTVIGNNWSFSFDTTFPILTINNPQNNTFYKNNISIDLSCLDSNLLRLNWTLQNSTILDSIENITVLNNQLQLGGVIDSTLYADNDSYVLDIVCSDSHTKRKIDNYLITLDIIKKEIRFKTSNYDEIYIEALNKNDVNTFYSIKQIDKYIFSYNYRSSLNKYSFKVTAVGIKYLKDSEYKAHFITERNWIDFELYDDPNAKYTITYLTDNSYQIDIITFLTKLNFKSVGDLNIEERFLILGFDNTVPTVSASINNVNTTVNVIATDIVNFEINCSDTNLANLTIFNNVSGILTLIQIEESPSSPFDFPHTAFEGVIAHRFDCNDIVNNSASSSLLIYRGSPPPFTPISLPIVNVMFTIIVILIGVSAVVSLISLLIIDFKDMNLSHQLLSIIGICVLIAILISFIPIIFNILS